MKKLFPFLLLLVSSNVYALDITVTYSWDSNAATDQVTQYQCEYSINGSAYSPCSSPVIPPANSITEVVAGVNSGDVLTMHVRACNVVGCSAFSPGASATVPPNLVPNVPTNEQILPLVIN